jgi:hypothetical protein
MRLNLRNEQHLRIHDVLKNLNPAIHKSLNQFMVNAVDYYIGSFDNDGAGQEVAGQKRDGSNEFVTNGEMVEIKREILDTLKEEMIRILGSTLVSGYMFRPPAISQNESEAAAKSDQEENSAVDSLVDKWG